MFPAGIRAAPFPAYAWLPPARLLLEPVNGSRTLYVDTGGNGRVPLGVAKCGGGAAILFGELEAAQA